MDRRGFLTNLLKLGIAPMILPPALTYAREWVTQRGLFVATDGVRPLTLSGSQFAQFLIDQQPSYDRLILQSIRPIDGWIAHVEMGELPVIGEDELYQDRFEGVYPDMRVVERADNPGAPLEIDFARKLSPVSPLQRIKNALNNFADKLAIS